MRIRTGLVGLVATAGMLAAALPATAAAAAPSIISTAQAQNLGNPGSSTTTNMALECVAAAPGAIGVSITECYLLGQNGAQYSAPTGASAPGVANARVGAFLSVPLQPYRACMRARAVYPDGTIQDTALTCSG